jgi:hypothetical protein
VKRRLVIRDDADLLIEAEREIASFLAPLVAELAASHARFLVAAEIERRDLIPRSWVTDQPTAVELLTEILRGLEEHALRPGASAVGAHDRARRIGVSLGLVGAEDRPVFRRTRAEVDDDPNPRREREGTRGLVGGVHRGDVAGR